MARPVVISFEDKFRLVCSVISGEVSVAEAARRSRVSEQSIGNWKRQFLEGGKPWQAPVCRSGRYGSRVVSLVSSLRRRRPGFSSRGCRAAFGCCRCFSNLQVRRLLLPVS